MVLGATKVIAVASPDDDLTTYVSGIAGQAQDFTFANTALTNDDYISNVRITIRNKGTSAGQIARMVLTAGASGSLQNLTQAVGWTSDTYDHTTAPFLGDWNPTRLNAMNVTIYPEGGTLDVTTVFATVTFVTGGKVGGKLTTVGVG